MDPWRSGSALRSHRRGQRFESSRIHKMISVVILTRNEEKNIKDCFQTIQWCNEIIIIDDFSEDKTTFVAEKLGVKVYQRRLGNDFANQRNFGLEKAKGDWVLFIDADERVSEELGNEIRRVVKETDFDAFYFKREDFIWGKKLKYGETSRVKLLRLGKRGVGKWQRKVHEIWRVKGRIGQLNNSLIHYPHQNLTEFVEHLNFHSSLHAQALKKEGEQFRLWKIIAYPLVKFFQNYFFRLGFLDGFPGLLVALMMSWHSFLARAKLFNVKNS